MTPLTDSLRYLAREFSASASDFKRDNAPGGEMKLMGLLSKGYALQVGDRVAVSEAGHRKLSDEMPDAELEAKARGG